MGSIIKLLLGWLGIPQWGLELIALALAAAATWGVYEHIYDKGKAAELATIKAQDAKETAALQTKADTAEHSHDQELSDLRAYRDSNPVSLHLDPVPALSPACKVAAGNRAVSPTTGSVQQVPTGDTGIRTSPTTPDIGGLLDALAARADQVSSQLRVYQQVQQ